RLLTLLPISLANSFPDIQSQNPGNIQYAASSTSFTINTTDVALLQGFVGSTLVSDSITVDSAGTRQSSLQIHVNSSGQTTGGIVGDDLVVQGKVTIRDPNNLSDPTPYETYDGV